MPHPLGGFRHDFGNLQIDTIDYDEDGKDELILYMPSEGYLVLKDGNMIVQEEHHHAVVVDKESERLLVKYDGNFLTCFSGKETLWSVNVKPFCFGIGWGRDRDGELEFDPDEYFGRYRAKWKLDLLQCIDSTTGGEKEILLVYRNGLGYVYDLEGNRLREFRIAGGNLRDTGVFYLEDQNNRKSMIINYELRHKYILWIFEKFCMDDYVCVCNGNRIQRHKMEGFIASVKGRKNQFINKHNDYIAYNEGEFVTVGERQKNTAFIIDLRSRRACGYICSIPGTSKINYYNFARNHALWEASLPHDNISEISEKGFVIAPGDDKYYGIQYETKEHLSEHGVDVKRHYVAIYHESGALSGLIDRGNDTHISDDLCLFGERVLGVPYLYVMTNESIQSFELSSPVSNEDDELPESRLLETDLDYESLPVDLWKTDKRLIDQNHE